MSDVYVCMHKGPRLGGSRGMLPHEICNIRYCEIVSEAILAQKLSLSSYTWLTDYCIQFLTVHISCAIAKPADNQFCEPDSHARKSLGATLEFP